MKKMVAALLVAVMILSLCSCSAGMTAAEKYLIAVKKLDMQGLGTVQPMTEILYRNLDDEEKATLLDLYALLQYTIGEVSEENGVKFVSVTLKTPDVKRIFDLVDKQILVSAETAQQVISGMLESGTIAKTMMTEKTFLVKMVETDGQWLVDSGVANQEFLDTVGLEAVMNSFVLN